MKKLNFDNLTNIEVPESLIKSALNVPFDTPKHPFLPVRFYRFAAGIAACVVIAAAVTLSLMFGLHNDVDLTNPDPDTPTRSDLIIDNINPTSTPDVSEPSKAPPSQSGENAQSDSELTEPDKENNGYVNSNQQGAPQTNGRTATQTPDGKKSDKSNKSKKNPVSSDTQPLADEPVVTEPEDVDPPQTEPEEQPPTEGHGDEPLGSAVELWFTTYVYGRFIEGEAYCRIEDENGNVFGNSDLYDSSRVVYKSTAYSNWIRLYLTDTANLGLISGKIYNVIFYNSQGRILKQGLVFINPNETIVYEI